MSSNLPPSLYDYLERPKLCAPNDFWNQVRRTVKGRNIEPEQLEKILSFVRQGLDFNQKDVLLDLCCGNGRLGLEFFPDIHGYLGVDMSEYLIEIARNNFQKLPDYYFINRDVKSYVQEEINPERFTKCLLFGSVGYLSPDDLKSVLVTLRCRFTEISKVFVAPIPDRNKAQNFYHDFPVPDLNDYTSAIGRWYTKSEFTNLAKSCEWNCKILDLPEEYYQSHYRFNALLS
jgi:SAM-dependent methyltransferase